MDFISSYGSLKSEAIRSSPKNIYSIRKVSLDARAKQIINHFSKLHYEIEHSLHPLAF